MVHHARWSSFFFMECLSRAERVSMRSRQARPPDLVIAPFRPLPHNAMELNNEIRRNHRRRAYPY